MSKSRKSSLGLAALGAAWLGVFAFGGYELFGKVSPSAHQIRPKGYRENVSHTAAATHGGDRLDMLVKATRRYVAQHKDAAPEIVSGRQLAPVEFLNHELESQGKRWRVRDVHGLAVKMYDVS